MQTENKLHWATKEDFQNEDNPAAICAMALMNWGNCMSGLDKLPADFGEGMQIAGEKLGIIPTPENVQKKSNDFLV